MITIYQWNQTARLYEIQVTIIYSRAIFVAVTSERRLKRMVWGIDKQCKARSDATERGVCSRYALFAKVKEVKG